MEQRPRHGDHHGPGAVVRRRWWRWWRWWQQWRWWRWWRVVTVVAVVAVVAVVVVAGTCTATPPPSATALAFRPASPRRATANGQNQPGG